MYTINLAHDPFHPRNGSGNKRFVLKPESHRRTNAETHLPAVQRSSITFMISSAHRTASATALTVPGTFFPPSSCVSLRAAGILCRDQWHAFTALVHSGSLAYSLFIRLTARTHTHSTTRKM